MGAFDQIEVPSYTPEQVLIGRKGLLVITCANLELVGKLVLPRQSCDESVRFVLRESVEDELGAVEGPICETVARFIGAEGIESIFKRVR